jgi:hypothetical protein
MNLYGLDYVAMGFSLSALILLGTKRRMGFLSFMLANISWVGVGLLIHSPVILVGNLIFFATNLRGFLIWKTCPEPEAAHVRT